MESYELEKSIWDHSHFDVMGWHDARIWSMLGKDVPPELRELPAGRYVVEAVEEEAPVLSPEEQAGIEAALESHRQGRVVDAKRAREIIDAALSR